MPFSQASGPGLSELLARWAVGIGRELLGFVHEMDWQDAAESWLLRCSCIVDVC